ncbi:hypothetical protein FHS14_001607 [Paenibacillus baekrokdamisoli]|nr:hypothetical protein [Paenibacillus baekrokdamisoli]
MNKPVTIVIVGAGNRSMIYDFISIQTLEHI